MAKKAIRAHVCLVCWNEEAAAAHANDLTRAGFRVTVVDRAMSGWITYFRDLAVDTVAIDLDRLPSHGREVGIVLRGSKSTRHLPLVYLGGVPAKVERLRHELPDAIYAQWSDATPAILRAVASPVERPVRPVQMMQRYGDADLARRLGVVAGLQIVTFGDADFLLDLLSPLPEDVSVMRSSDVSRRKGAKEAEMKPRLWLCVTRALADVAAAFDGLADDPHAKTLAWIVHPKQTSRYHSDFNQNDVRDAELARAWVDFKVCAIDKDWSGLKFARRKVEAPSKRRMTARRTSGKP